MADPLPAKNSDRKERRRRRRRQSDSQLPFSAEILDRMPDAVVIADLDGKPPVIYLETAAEGHITDSSSAVAHVALSFDRIRAGAESWAASRDLIRKVAEERWT